MSALRIDTKKITKLKEAAEKLGYRVIHIHADVKTPGEPARIKFDMQDRGKR